MDWPWFSSYDQGVSPTLDYPETALPDLLDQTASRFPGVAALYYFGFRMSYRRLNEEVNRFVNLLIREGVQPGDRVALYLPNCPPAVIAFFGAMRAGAIVTQLNPMYSSHETAFQLKDSGAKHVVALDRFAPILGQVAGECGLKKVWLTRISDYFPAPLKWFFPLKAMMNKTWVKWPSEPLFRSFVRELEGSPKKPVWMPLGMDKIALLQYTGGTTGVAKGVMLSHRNLVVNASQCRQWLPGVAEGKEVFMVVIPIFHCYGMTVGMNWAVMMGGTMVLEPKFDVKRVFREIQKYKVTLFPGIQAMYVAVNNHPHAKKFNLKSIRACISGAGPLHQEVQAKFEELTGGKLVEGYGLTEASPVTHCNPFFGRRKIGFIGVPLPGTESKIVDLETGNKDLKPGEIGELVLRGPQVMKGYWNNPGETALVLRNGWLYTGDIGSMDEEGFFKVVDRKKDMVKMGGENVYPREVEEILYQNEKIRDCAVAGVPDPVLVEKLKAFVVLKPGLKAEPKEIIDYCRGKIAKYKVPKEVEFRDSLPQNLAGKMLRRQLVDEEKKKVQDSKRG